MAVDAIVPAPVVPQATETSVTSPKTLARHVNEMSTAMRLLARRIAPAILYGTYSERPAAADFRAGTKYVASDGQVEFISDGATWRPLIHGVVGTEPCPSNRRVGYTQVGLAPTTVNVSGGCFYTLKSNTGTNSLSGFEVAKPGSSQFTVHLIPNIIGLSDTSTGVGLPSVWVRDTSGGKLETITFGETGNFLKVPVITVYQYTTLSTFSSEPAGQTHGIVMPASNGMWFRIKDTGISLVFSYSWDGANFNTVFTDSVPFVPGRGSAFGFGVNANGTAAGITIDSLRVD